MRFVFFIIFAISATGCMLTPPIGNHSRKIHPEISDLDNLEMLLLNDQRSIYEGRNIASQSSNVRLGMEKNRVKRSLGLPSQVEVAGNPKYGNERWIYETSVPTLDGYYKEKKIIYFEGGSVVGWESQ